MKYLEKIVHHCWAGILILTSYFLYLRYTVKKRKRRKREFILDTVYVNKIYDVMNNN